MLSHLLAEQHKSFAFHDPDLFHAEQMLGKHQAGLATSIGV
jgi:hypothetical protein